MKTIKIFTLLISLISLNAIAQNSQYIYIHGHSKSNADSIMYVAAISSVDSMDFHASLPTRPGFNDNFNSATLNTSWTTLSGLINVIADASVATTNFVAVGDNGNAASMICNDPTAVITPGHPFTLSVDFYINQGSGDASAFPGIMFDISANNQSYQLIRNCGANQCQILATNDGANSWSGVYQADITPRPTTAKEWYRYTITYDGVSAGIHLKINKISTGVVTLDQDFATRAINGGKVGLFGIWSVGYFDNFSFTSN